LNIAQGFGGLLNDFSVFFLTIVTLCATDDKDENKVVGTTESLA
jgi:hypothetical protein